tara:strand:- start:83 stop:544 length:462 start_codon:yes stop_codon:yes gene_type:complete
MASELWWVFVVAGIVLIISEIFTLTFITLWFGVAAIITAIPVYFGQSMNTVIFVYSASLILLFIYGRKLIKFFGAGEDDLTKTNFTKTSTAGYSGSIGIVTEKIGVEGIPGRVYVNKEDWSAISVNGKEIEKDEQVRILKIDGVKLIVEKKED